MDRFCLPSAWGSLCRRAQPRPTGSRERPAAPGHRRVHRRTLAPAEVRVPRDVEFIALYFIAFRVINGTLHRSLRRMVSWTGGGIEIPYRFLARGWVNAVSRMDA